MKRVNAAHDDGLATGGAMASACLTSHYLTPSHEIQHCPLADALAPQGIKASTVKKWILWDPTSRNTAVKIFQFGFVYWAIISLPLTYVNCKPFCIFKILENLVRWKFDAFGVLWVRHFDLLLQILSIFRKIVSSTFDSWHPLALCWPLDLRALSH